MYSKAFLKPILGFSYTGYSNQVDIKSFSTKFLIFVTVRLLQLNRETQRGNIILMFVFFVDFFKITLIETALSFFTVSTGGMNTASKTKLGFSVNMTVAI